MSISRKRENEYNHCIYKMMFTLARRCVQAIIGEEVDHQKFAALIGKLFGILTKLEEERFIHFKFSESLQELTQLLGLYEENHDIILNNQQKYKIQLQQQPKLLEPNTKNLNPVKYVSKLIDQSNIKQVGFPKRENDLREGNESRNSSNVKEMKEINQHNIRNSFFIRRKSMQTENGYQKTLEQKERDFLDRFRQGLEDH